MKIIDATGLIAGRLATRVAKLALLGESVAVVNSEKAIFSGRRETVMKRFSEREARVTPYKGPFRVRSPDRILRRVIRGMLPFKRARGKEAFSKVMCYIEVPNEFKDKKIETVESASAKNLKTQHFVTIGEISKLLREG